MLHHPDGALWRCSPHHETERWRPMAALWGATRTRTSQEAHIWAA